jgi:hypothetical protein
MSMSTFWSVSIATASFRSRPTQTPPPGPPRGKHTFTISADVNPQLTQDGSWVINKGNDSMRMPANGFLFDGVWISDRGIGDEDQRVALYATQAERIFKETDYATNLLGYGHGPSFSAYRAGSITDAILAHDDPQALHQRREKSLSNSIRRMRKVIDAFWQYIQLVTMLDDMGTQRPLVQSSSQRRWRICV